jgi:hypothetical protein
MIKTYTLTLTERHHVTDADADLQLVTSVLGARTLFASRHHSGLGSLAHLQFFLPFIRTCTSLPSSLDLPR